MPLVNQDLIIFKARDVFDAATIYRGNDWMVHNGIPYLASRTIAAGNPPDDVDNPTNGWARLGDSVIEGPRGLVGIQGNGVIPVYQRGATQPTTPTATWDGVNLTVSTGWTTTIPSGTDILYRSDLTLDNVALTASATGVGRWTGPTGPEPSDTRLNTLITTLLTAMDLTTQDAVNTLIQEYLENNQFRTGAQIRDIINEAYRNVLRDLGAIQVEFALNPTSDTDWHSTLTFYDRFRIRLNSPDAEWITIMGGPASGGSTTGLPLTFQYTSDTTDADLYHDSPQVDTDTDYRFKVGTGDYGDWQQIGGDGGGITLTTQYSVDGTQNWHDTVSASDEYIQFTIDGGLNWWKAQRSSGTQGGAGVITELKTYFARGSTAPTTPSYETTGTVGTDAVLSPNTTNHWYATLSAADTAEPARAALQAWTIQAISVDHATSVFQSSPIHAGLSKTELDAAIVAGVGGLQSATQVDAAIMAALSDYLTESEIDALVAGGGLTQAQVITQITNRIAPRVFVATAAFTQSGLNFINISVAPTTTDAPAVGDIVMVRTPASIVTTTGVALALIIDGIGGEPAYILDRSDGLPLNASDLATDNIYMTIFDGTNFELTGPPLSPRVALTTGAVFTGVTEGLDPTTDQGFVTRSLLNLQTPTYTAVSSTWDEASQTITLMLTGGVSVNPGDEIIFLVPPILTGQDDTAVTIDINGRSGTLRTFQSLTMSVLSRELVPREILLIQASGGNTYRMLEPHIVQRTGVWSAERLYVLGQEVERNGFDYKLLAETSTNQNPETNPTVWLRFPHRWQDEGVTFTDAITGVNFAGAGVSGAVVGGILTLAIPGGGTPTPTHALWVGWSADTTITETEVLAGASSDSHAATIPTITDNQYLFVWRSDTDGGDPAEVHIGSSGNVRNTLGAATALTVDSVAGQVIVSVTTQNGPLLSSEIVRVI